MLRRLCIGVEERRAAFDAPPGKEPIPRHVGECLSAWATAACSCYVRPFCSSRFWNFCFPCRPQHTYEYSCTVKGQKEARFCKARLYFIVKIYDSFSCPAQTSTGRVSPSVTVLATPVLISSRESTCRPQHTYFDWKYVCCGRQGKQSSKIDSNKKGSKRNRSSSPTRTPYTVFRFCF